MAGEDLPVYTARAPAADNEMQTISGVTPPNYDTDKLGGAMSAFAEKLLVARQETLTAEATTGYITGLAALRKRYEDDQDFKTAPDRFANEAGALETKWLGNIDNPVERARTALTFRHAKLIADKNVTTAAFTRETAHNTALLNDSEIVNLRDAATAASPIERQAVIARHGGQIDAQVAAGYIEADKGQALKRRFNVMLENADVMDVIQKDPDHASKLLADPKMFPDLDPVARQRYIDAASTASDRRAELFARDLAMRDPQRAALWADISTMRGGRDKVFSDIVQIETGGQNVVGADGEAGPAQVMPDTARAVLRKVGRADLAGLDDATLRTKLMENNGALSVEVGAQHFNDLLARYQGRYSVAAAAYNKGEKRADEWLAKTVAQHGPYFTASQFIGNIDSPVAQDYVTKLFKQRGVDPGAGDALSTEGRMRIANVVRTQLMQDERERAQLTKATATAARDGVDYSEMFRQGQSPDPVQYQSWLATQAQAADIGDHSAQKALHDTLFQQSMAPVRDQAYRLPPAMLVGTVATAEAALRRGPATPDQIDQVEVLKGVRDDVIKRAKDDPVGLGERAKLFDPVMIDPKAAATDPGFVTALARRGGQAQAAQTFYGGDYKVLKPAEAAGFQARFSQAGPDEQFGILRAAGGVLDERGLRSFVDQIGGDGATAFAALLARDRPELAREVLAGHALAGSKGVKDKADLIRPAFVNKFGGLVYPTADMQNGVIEAALSLYTNRRATSGAMYDATDTGGIEKAIEDIAGPIVKRNGVRMPVAPGLQQGLFLDTLDHLQQVDLDMAGGARDRAGNAIDADTISRYGVLKPVAPGDTRYFVGMRDPAARDGFRPFFTDSEMPSPLVFNMRDLTARHRADQSFNYLPSTVTSQQRFNAGLRRIGPLPGDKQP